MLKIKNLKKVYPDDSGRKLPVVEIEEFNLKEGESIALYGESGSGKTTFLHLVAGILKIDEGSIHFNGLEMHRLGEHQRDLIRARSIGYVFQSFHLLQGYTVLENLLIAMAFAGKVEASRAKRFLEVVGLANRMNHAPHQLSVGQQQRVALARALINQPKLLLADEPTGNLDLGNASIAIELIKELCADNKTAMIIVSHDPKVISSFENKLDWSDLNRAADNLASL